MRSFTGSAMKTVLCCLLALTAFQRGNDSPREPRYYQTFPDVSGDVVLENERLVVQRFVLQPGQSEGVHAHAGKQLSIFIKGGRWTTMTGGKESSSVVKDGSVFWQDPVDIHANHQARNSGTAPIEYLWVTLKTPPPNATGAAPNYRLVYPNIPGELQLDNAHVVVQRFVIKPGEWEGLHPHPGNQLYVHVLGGKWAVRYGEKETVSDSKTGSVGWYHAVTLSEQHQSGNAGDSPIDLIWVTLKR
jgi:quercetin dioxygenase-like cupin family protein